MAHVMDDANTAAGNLSPSGSVEEQNYEIVGNPRLEDGAQNPITIVTWDGPDDKKNPKK